MAEKRFLDLVEEDLLKKNHPAQVIFIDRLYNETSTNAKLKTIAIELNQNINCISVEGYVLIELSCEFLSRYNQ